MVTRSVASSAEIGTLAEAPQLRWYPPVKRVLDVCLSALGLVFSLPLWLLTGAAILLEDGPPIFYRREVGGKDGKPFRLLKFRTMTRAEHHAADVDPRQDGRVTRVGRTLRPTALDELPSLWHILKGEMSFVGPRTLLLRVEDPADPDVGRPITSLPNAALRQSVRPGLTGLAQVYGPKHLPYRRKFRYDALYVRRMSPWLDLRLLAASFLRAFRSQWR